MKSFLRKIVNSARGVLDKADVLLGAENAQKEEEAAEKEGSHEHASLIESVSAPTNENSNNGLASTAQGRIGMNNLLREWSGASGRDLKELKAELRAHAGVRRIDYMTVGQVENGCAWIESNITTCKGGQQPQRMQEQGELPVPREKQGKLIS